MNEGAIVACICVVLAPVFIIGNAAMVVIDEKEAMRDGEITVDSLHAAYVVEVNGVKMFASDVDYDVLDVTSRDGGPITLRPWSSVSVKHLNGMTSVLCGGAEGVRIDRVRWDSNEY